MADLNENMIELLKDMLEAHERVLGIANARYEAMRAFDMQSLNMLMAREMAETQALGALENRRRDLMAKYRVALGPKVEICTREIAKRADAPTAERMLALAAQLKDVVGKLEKVNRLNARISGSVVQSLAKVVKVLTGMAQHAGLYMKNGRKASLRGVHMLDATA